MTTNIASNPTGTLVHVCERVLGFLFVNITLAVISGYDMWLWHTRAWNRYRRTPSWK